MNLSAHLLARAAAQFGRVLDGIELAIVDASGREVSDGEIGEITVRGPNVMAGYYEAPADTAHGGQNIYPADIEEIVFTCEAVDEAAVVAHKDAELGAVPVAFVAPKLGNRIALAELLECCHANLAPFKLPVEIKVLHRLPKGPTGKIPRRELRDHPGGLA
ncbi:AMP-binding protein [Sphingomonas sp.]|uniref:AMP-binding enzyme n=1 Tax=Sphingomonas sp. TaxID=28214 RepID=UPI0025F94F90|nr:AMP-binding protein [Sphingomonas sp.]